jgi:hypothetical protein
MSTRSGDNRQRMDQLLRTFEFFEGGLIKVKRTSHQLWLITIYPMMMKITLCRKLYSALIKSWLLWQNSYRLFNLTNVWVRKKIHNPCLTVSLVPKIGLTRYEFKSRMVPTLQDWILVHNITYKKEQFAPFVCYNLRNSCFIRSFSFLKCN